MKLNTFSSLQRATLDILCLIDLFQFLHQKVISDVEIGINIGMKNINRIGSQEESKHSDKKNDYVITMLMNFQLPDDSTLKIIKVI